MSESLASMVPLIGPIGLVAVAAIARFDAGQRPRRVQTTLAIASGAGVVAALVSVVLYGLLGSHSSDLLGAAGVGASIRVDGLTVAIFTMVALLVVVVARFSATYLDGDERHGDFLGRLAATAAAVELLVLANNLVLFWLAWVATSLCLHRLLVFYPDRPRAVIAARKKFVAARLGDVFLGAAFVLVYWHFGTGELDKIFSSAESGTALVGVAAVLLALTALFKSAQFPTHGWLVEVMETPTPVSALLHAGILNAGPFLVLRFSPLVAQVEAAAWILLVVGGFTALFASVVLTTQPSVKVALGYSSAAHMGFMLFVCGLGVFPAAALHLVAHSFYKAHAFLSAGSTVDATSRVVVPARLRRPSNVLAGLVIAAATYVLVATAFGFTPWDHPSLLLVGAIVVLGTTQLIGAGLDRESRISVRLRVVAMAGIVTTAFFGLEELTRLLLERAVPPLYAPPPATVVIAAVVVATWALAVAIQVGGWGRRTPIAQRLRVHLRNGLYANALFDRLVEVRQPARGTR